MLKIVIEVVDESSFTVQWEKPSSGQYDAFVLHLQSENYTSENTIY